MRREQVMNDENAQLLAQAERCRRLASVTVDDELRHSFEELAREYEAKLSGRGEGFMLRNGQGDR